MPEREAAQHAQLLFDTTLSHDGITTAEKQTIGSTGPKKANQDLLPERPDTTRSGRHPTTKAGDELLKQQFKPYYVHLDSLRPALPLDRSWAARRTLTRPTKKIKLAIL